MTTQVGAEVQAEKTLGIRLVHHRPNEVALRARVDRMEHWLEALIGELQRLKTMLKLDDTRHPEEVEDDLSDAAVSQLAEEVEGSDELTRDLIDPDGAEDEAALAKILSETDFWTSHMVARGSAPTRLQKEEVKARIAMALPHLGDPHRVGITWGRYPEAFEVIRAYRKFLPWSWVSAMAWKEQCEPGYAERTILSAQERELGEFWE